MAGMINVKYNKAQLANIQRMFKDTPKVLPRIMSRAVNSTAKKAHTQVARQIANESKMPVSGIKKKIYRRKATYSQWISTLTISRSRIPLIKFKARQTKKGVTFASPDGSGRSIKEHAFIATMATGHRGVFKRAGASRLPIHELYGTSMHAIFEDAQQAANSILRDTRRALRAEVSRLVQYELDKRRAG